MRPGREIDAQVAQEIFGYEVFAKNKVLHESAEKGPRPLRNYSKEMQWAWLVAEKMRVSLIPIENGFWFGFIGPQEGWSAPEAFLEFLKAGDFAFCGASVGENPAQVICEAALVAHQKRKLSETKEQASTPPAQDNPIEETFERDQLAPDPSSPSSGFH